MIIKLSPRFRVNIDAIAFVDFSTLDGPAKLKLTNRNGQVFATLHGEDAVAADQALQRFIERGPEHKWGKL